MLFPGHVIYPKKKEKEKDNVASTANKQQHSCGCDLAACDLPAVSHFRIYFFPPCYFNDHVH